MNCKLSFFKKTSKLAGYVGMYVDNAPPKLPLPAFLLAVVDDGAGPAVELADVGDVLLLGGGDGTVAAAHLEIVLASPHADELVTDVALHAGRHVNEHFGHAALHEYPLAVTEHLAILSTGFGVVGIDAQTDVGHRIGVLAEDPAQTLVVERALVDVAQVVVLGLLAEDLFLLLSSCFCLVYCFHASKVRKISQISKYFSIFFLE